MSEAAIEKIDDLVTESQSQSEEAPKLYRLDQAEIIVEVSTPTAVLFHKLRKPTLIELIERDRHALFETEEVSSAEDRLSIDDEAPNGKLWDKLALEIRGYRGHGLTFSEWAKVTPELAAIIPTGHKSTAVRGLYQTQFEVEHEEGEGFALGASVYTVVQTLQGCTLRHILRPPTEAERRDFKRRASETRFARGARRVRTKILTHLQAYTELYDKLFVGLDYATVGGDIYTHSGQRGAFLAHVDPIWKRGAVDALMRQFEASLSD